MNTTFNYIYRDGDNYKASGAYVLCGLPLIGMAAFIEALKKTLSEGEYFIASQVDVPEVFLWKDEYAPTDADHSWHEFFSIEETDAQSDTDLTPEMFLKSFERASEEGWKEFEVTSGEEGVPGISRPHAEGEYSLVGRCIACGNVTAVDLVGTLEHEKEMEMQGRSIDRVSNEEARAAALEMRRCTHSDSLPNASGRAMDYAESDITARGKSFSLWSALSRQNSKALPYILERYLLLENWRRESIWDAPEGGYDAQDEFRYIHRLLAESVTVQLNQEGRIRALEAAASQRKCVGSDSQ